MERILGHDALYEGVLLFHHTITASLCMQLIRSQPFESICPYIKPGYGSNKNNRNGVLQFTRYRVYHLKCNSTSINDKQVRYSVTDYPSSFPGRCSHWLHKNCAISNTVNSPAKRVFIPEHYFASKWLAVVHQLAMRVLTRNYRIRQQYTDR